MFQMLSGALAAYSQSRELPASLKFSNLYGPLDFGPSPGAMFGEVTADAVIRAAAEIAPRLMDDSWKPVPGNAVPAVVDVAGTRVNAAQFLYLMAQVYLNPTPAGALKLHPIQMVADIAGSYPHHAPLQDMGNHWTLKPAALSLNAVTAAPAAPQTGAVRP
jgi:hypothetical protein